MRVALLSAAGLLLILTGPLLAGPVDFTREVRPILAAHCFKCHGPDAKVRKGKLRLDERAGAVGEARSGLHAVVPGKPDESELVRRIFATDETEVMPPPSTKHVLTTAEKETLRRWVAEGAEYKTHWAFLPPQPQSVPRSSGDAAHPIDAFIRARLEREGLQPAPRADRYTLVRRVYLDLVGMPPTPAEADAFVQNNRPDAYERLVDRLLASPRYGERWARRWLDLARYADTNGYEKDRVRSIWPYRDWVINALNADLPFDQFTIEQLAGDLLPHVTASQRIATGFHRNTMLNEEGGIDPLEFRYHAMTDRVNTTGTVWLGLTVGCAQCHSHKYDPIPHEDYYRLMAFLDNADEPEMDVPDTRIAARRSEIQREIARREAELPKRLPREQLEENFEAWLKAESARAGRWTVLRPRSATSNLPKLTVLDDASVLVSGDMSKRDVYELALPTNLRGITAIRLEVLPHDSLPHHGPGRVYYEGPFGDFFLSEVTLSAGGKPIRFARASQSFANGASVAAKAIDGDPLTGWSIAGGVGKIQTAVFNLAEPLREPGTLNLRLLFERYYAAGLGRFRVSVTTDPKAEAHTLPPYVEELLLLSANERTAAQRDRLLRYFCSVAPELAEARKEIDALRARLPAFPTTLVLAERPPDNPRPTFVHKRGEYLQPAEPVQPGVPAALPQLPPDSPPNRLTFARWLVDPRNPLTARVTVNRHWAAFFGRGIVRTTEDFGLQGDPPSHPELLDWLALEFVRQGWSVKRLHRLIVTSATYQQDARATPELLRRDPQNVLLARGPRVRLEAELVRDTLLRTSGLLAEKLGGPSVFPPQPPGVTSEGTYGALPWKVSDGPDRYRRGLYTFSKRTAPYALFNTFDAPSGEACLARREVSNTPLQALTLLNDAVSLEAAQALGKQLAAEQSPVPIRIEYLFRRCLTRLPTADEANALVDFYKKQMARFDRKELNAAALAGPGATAEQAAWTATARAVLNLDEMITKE